VTKVQFKGMFTWEFAQRVAERAQELLAQAQR
jgi:hypothetical protein